MRTVDEGEEGSFLLTYRLGLICSCLRMSLLPGGVSPQTPRLGSARFAFVFAALLSSSRRSLRRLRRFVFSRAASRGRGEFWRKEPYTKANYGSTMALTDCWAVVEMILF
jgi:hypothetical protein